MDKSFLSVAIILVNYNGYQDTAECIRSIKRIKYSKYEIIVVDNCSSDQSYEELRKLQDSESFVLLRAHENFGFSAGNNIGIHYAMDKDFDFILLLNNDTVVTPDFLNELMNHISDDHTVASGTILYYGKPDTVWYGGGTLGRYSGRVRHLYYEKNKKELPQKSADVNFLSGCEMLIPMKAFREIGMLEEAYFLYEEDADYCIRLMKAGYRLLYVPESVIYHKVSASTVKIKDETYYYLARNKRILLYRHFKWYHIIPALIFTNIQAWYRMIQGRISLRCVMIGVIDFYAGKRGRAEFGKGKK